jgi:hypothetical protein
MLIPDSDRLSTLSDMPTSPLNIECIFIFSSAFLCMRLILIISPFLASSSFRGEVGSSTTEGTTSSSQVTTSTSGDTSTSTTEETTSSTVETTSSTIETSSTSEGNSQSSGAFEVHRHHSNYPAAFDFGDPTIVFLRERAQAQLSQPSHDHNADSYCIAFEDVIPDLMRAIIESIRRMDVRERSQLCPELNLGKFMQAICPEYWSSRKKHVHSLAVQHALWCSSLLGRAEISVDRSRIIDSTIYHLGSETDYRKYIRITFEGENGQDAGGLFKDWVTSFSTQFMLEDDFLFELDVKANQLSFSDRAIKSAHRLRHLTIFGRFLGIVAGRDQATAPISLPLVYYSKLLDKPLIWDSLSEDEKRVTGFHATMLMDSNPMADEIGGAIWTLENRLELVHRAINHLSEDEMVKIGYVKSGLKEVLSEDVMNLLSPQDLQGMIEGDSEIDPADLLRNREFAYSSISGQKKYTDTVEWFERLVSEGMKQEDLKKLIQFVTGLARPPLGGFSKLNPKFTLNIYNGPASNLPTAHTCSNTIDIPIYESEDVFVEKLYLAINSDPAMGFL